VTIGQAVAQAVERWGAQEALVSVHQRVRFTWREFGDRVNEYAAGLVGLGFQPGDRLGIWAINVWEWAVAQFATAQAGIVLVNINPAYRSNELAYVLNKVGCAGLITGVAFKTSDYIAMLNGLLPELSDSAPGQLAAAAVPTLRTVIRLGDETSPGMLNFAAVPAAADAAARRRLAEIETALDPHDPINIQFTSGTTGAPKGATLSHHNMVGGNLVAVTCGAAMVYPEEAFEPGAVLHAIARERCTSLYGVPTMFVALLEHPDFATADVASLRTGIMAGAPCPIELMKQAVSRLHMPQITIAYGMTETSPVSFQSRRDDPVEKRVGTVGRIHPHAEAKIVDDGGTTVAIGEQGEIMTRGYLVMQGYWNDAERTAEALEDGWIHTGDLGTLDAEGWLRITGRVKDMIIRGGENVYPREIEEFLYRHPKILEAQVFGVPDAKFGEEVAVWIQLREGEQASAEEIREFCRGEIAHYKIPRYVRFVDEFPMTVTGKIQKFQMRRALVEELGLTEAETA
jgi:fatty-acyl-CoA synthase